MSSLYWYTTGKSDQSKDIDPTGMEIENSCSPPLENDANRGSLLLHPVLAIDREGHCMVAAVILNSAVLLTSTIGFMSTDRCERYKPNKQVGLSSSGRWSVVFLFVLKMHKLCAQNLPLPSRMRIKFNHEFGNKYF